MKDYILWNFNNTYCSRIIVFYMLHLMSIYNMKELLQYNVQFDDAMEKAISGEIFCWHLYLTMTYIFVKHRQFLFYLITRDFLVQLVNWQLCQGM